MANHSKSLLESKGRSWWMRYVSNTSTGESRPEVTSGTASAFTASSDCWSSARSSSSSRPIASSNAQTVKLDAMARTWPGHGLGPFSTDQLHLDILTSCDWAAQVMSSKQEGCQISLDERKRQKSQEMKYNFVAVRGTETKPCPGLSWSPCTKTGCESNDFVFQAMSPKQKEIVGKYWAWFNVFN